MTAQRRVLRARLADLARSLPPAKRILEIGIAGDNPPGANREFFVPAEGGSYETLDNDASLKPDYALDITDWVRPDLAHTFDLVICSQVLEHVWQLEAAAKGLWLLTAWGGRCIVDLPFLYPPHGEAAGQDDYWRLTPAALERLLRMAGFPHVEGWHDPAWLVSQAVALKGQP